MCIGNYKLKPGWKNNDDKRKKKEILMGGVFLFRIFTSLIRARLLSERI